MDYKEKVEWLGRYQASVSCQHMLEEECDEISLAGFPSTAVRFSNRLAIPYSHDLTD